MANINNVRKTFTNLSDPQQIRELNRQMEWLWHQLFGGLTEKSFQAGYETRTVKRVQDQIAVNLDADNASIDNLKASLARLMVAQIAVADLDFAQIRDFVANAMIIDRGVGDEIYINNLSVTSANMLNAVIRHLVLTDGNDAYYEVGISSDGTIQLTDMNLTAEEIAAGKTETGRPIVTDVIVADTIDGKNIRAEEAIINNILSSAINTGYLSATEALIASASIPLLRATAIEALESSMSFVADGTINLITGIDELLRMWFTFASDGLHTHMPNSPWSTLVDNYGFHIDNTALPEGSHVSSFAKDRIIVPGIQAGNGIVAYAANDGSWVWMDAEEV